MPWTGVIKDVGAEDLINVFSVNVGTAQRVTSALIPALQRGREKKIIMM
jgi:NAD(P)-dependent dehydrogenase (short-subunit alcohol dehydrogenase family)